MSKAYISAINRLRIESDGKGVTSLVALYGCPLHCKYCINKNMEISPVYEVTVERLYDLLRRDDLYFTYTNGGICFGGHEPLLQSEFIKDFAGYLKYNNINWNLYLESSLNVKSELLIQCIPYISSYIIDVKTFNEDIYEKYTNCNNKLVLENLKILVKNVNQKCIKIRLPYIQNYNDLKDIEISKSILLNHYGFMEENIEIFDYIIK